MSTSTTVAASSNAGVGSATTAPPGPPITIGQLADVSGPIPGLFSGAVDGLDAWAAYVNSTGGISGRKVVVNHIDSALSCTTFTNGIKALATSSFAIVGTESAVDTCGATTLKANPGLPYIPALIYSSPLGSLPNVFAPSPEPPGFPTAAYLWVKTKFGDAAVQKAAGLYTAVVAPLWKGQSGAAASVGYHYVYSRGIGQSETNFTSDILRMKSEGVEIVDLEDIVVGAAASFLQEAAQQGFHPKAVLAQSPYDTSFFKLLGDPADAAPLIMPLGYAMYLGQDAASVPEITTMNTWLQKTHPGAGMNIFVLEAWVTGLLFQQAMTKAGPNATQAQLLSALQGITTFNANNLIPTDNPGQKQPVSCTVIADVVNGQFARVDPPTSGYDCVGSYYLLPQSS